MARTPNERIDLSLTEDLVKKACAIVEAGNFRTIAFQRLGISKNTWASWIQRGKKEIREFDAGKRDKLTVKATLVRELDAAEARCHQRLLQDVVDSEDPRVKTWFLERRYGKLYSRNPNAHVDDETGTEVKLDANQVLAEKLGQLLGALNED
jgi:hypothetical protein